MEIDERWLDQQGIKLENKNVAKVVAAARAELSMRVGYNIAEHLSDKQISQFEKMLDDNVSEAKRIVWLEKAYPAYSDVVAAETDKISKELRDADDPFVLAESWIKKASSHS